MTSLIRNEPGAAGTLRVLRTLLLIIFLLGLMGTTVELLLVGHVEEFWQFLPLVIISLTLVVLGWCAAHRGSASMRAFQGTMMLFIVSGCVGLWLHYRANVEFALETHPPLRGATLFLKAINGAVPPTLAPGIMIQLGLLGLAYAYGHPALTQGNVKKSSDDGE
jgi:hypothetical protein